MEVIVPELTKHGVIKGRSALFLDRITFPHENQLILAGEINASEGDEEYEIKFDDIIYLSMIELDFYTRTDPSSFGTIVNSTLLSKFRELDHSAKVDDAHKHFFFCTYDTVFEIIASSYQLTFRPLKPPSQSV